MTGPAQTGTGVAGTIGDEAWFEAVVKRDSARAGLPFPLPSLPPPRIQKIYNAQHGLATLKHGFAIYRVFRHWLPSERRDPMIMDFGAGWGRIARFFLRDTAAANIWAVDPLEDSVRWMRKTGLPCTIVRSAPLPPIPGAAGAGFDLIYANSVFSHLSEDYFNTWVQYLLSLLKPTGLLVFTTRGQAYLDRIEAQSKRDVWQQRRVFGDVSDLKARYARGEFIFLRNRGDDSALSGSFFGHALVPRAYIEARHPGVVEFSENKPGLRQAVVVVRPPNSGAGRA